MARLLCILMICFLAGCATIAERGSTARERHPCGNVWDVCPGDSRAVDFINRILQGEN